MVKKSQIKINILDIMKNPNDKKLLFFLSNLLEKDVNSSGVNSRFKEKIEQYKIDVFTLLDPIYRKLTLDLDTKASKKLIKI